MSIFVDESEVARTNLGHSGDRRINVIDKAHRERFSAQVDQTNLQTHSTRALRKAAQSISEGERLLVIVCAHRADEEDIENFGPGSRGDFLIRENETGAPKFLSQQMFLKAISDREHTRISLLTTSCFAGNWENLPKYTLSQAPQMRSPLHL